MSEFATLIEARHNPQQGFHYVPLTYKLVEPKHSTANLEFGVPVGAKIIPAASIIPFDGLRTFERTIEERFKANACERWKDVMDSVVEWVASLKVPYFTLGMRELTSERINRVPATGLRDYKFSVQYQMWIPR